MSYMGRKLKMGEHILYAIFGVIATLGMWRIASPETFLAVAIPYLPAMYVAPVNLLVIIIVWWALLDASRK